MVDGVHALTAAVIAIFRVIEVALFFFEERVYGGISQFQRQFS